jgi:hypothetical protein
LKQIDLNGETTFTEWIQVDVPTSVSESQPLEFALLQNYPNPFNPTTQLSFVIGHSSFVTLKIFDLLGREVAVLADKPMSAGRYDVAFNANDLAGGVYFYTLNAGSFRQTRKLVIAK